MPALCCCLSLQVLYPDGQSHVIHPKPGDFRKPGPDRHRLITQVYLSHTAWTGLCTTHKHLEAGGDEKNWKQ